MDTKTSPYWKVLDIFWNSMMFEATQPLIKKFLIMEAVQYLRPQWTKWDQNFTIWEGYWYIWGFHDVWGHTASIYKILEYESSPIYMASNSMEYIQNPPTWWITEAWVIGQPPYSSTRISFLEAIWPQTSWTLKTYPKCYHMEKFWS